MAREPKYLVAVNGTYHLRKPGMPVSYCGRVKTSQEGVKLTSVLPKGKALEGLTTCGRCSQLSGAPDMATAYSAVSNTVKDVPGVGKVAVVTTRTGRKAISDSGTVELVSKPAVKAAKAPVAPTANAGKGRGRKAAVTATDGVDDAGTITVVADVDETGEHSYQPISALLAHNEIEAVMGNEGPDGTLGPVVLTFHTSGWDYTVLSPGNSGENGWVVQYSDGTDSGMAPVTDQSDVITWLINDLNLKRPPVKRARKNAAKVAAVETPDDVKTQQQDTAKRLVSSHLVTIMSNAASAREYAEQYGGFTKEFLAALEDMAKSAEALRRTI